MKCVPSRLLLAVAFAGSLLPAADTSDPQSNWVRVERRDKVSGVASASYLITGETEDIERHPYIVLTCDGTHEPVLLYHTGVRLASQAHNVYDRYAESIWAYVKVDNAKIYRALWEIVPSEDKSFNRAAIDKKTLRSVFTGEKMRVTFRDSQDEQHIDQFTLDGLTASDVQPFCTAKWIAKVGLADATRSTHVSRSPQ